MGMQVLCVCCLQFLMMKLCHSPQQLVMKQVSSLCWSWSWSEFTITWSISLNVQKNLHFLPVGWFCPVLTPLPAHHRFKMSISDAPREIAGVHPSQKGRGTPWHLLPVVIFQPSSNILPDLGSTLRTQLEMLSRLQMNRVKRLFLYPSCTSMKITASSNLPTGWHLLHPLSLNMIWKIKSPVKIPEASTDHFYRTVPGSDEMSNYITTSVGKVSPGACFS